MRLHRKACQCYFGSSGPVRLAEISRINCLTTVGHFPDSALKRYSTEGNKMTRRPLKVFLLLLKANVSLNNLFTLPHGKSIDFNGEKGVN